MRHATQVVAWTTMPGSAAPWLPGASPEGPRRAGIWQRRRCQSAPKYTWGASSPLRGRIFLRKTLLCPARSHHSRRRLSRIPSRKATTAPAEICSALPQIKTAPNHSASLESRVCPRRYAPLSMNSCWRLLHACLPAQVCACTAANRGLRAMVLPENGLPPRIAKISCQLSIWDKMWKNLSCAY